MENLFVIVVTYNGIKWIDKCLGSIYQSTIPVTTIVIDNNSSDNTVEYIKANFPMATLFDYQNNLGFGKANNIGIEYALKNNADYIYLLNQDAWVDPDTFESIIKIQKSYPYFGVLSPMQMNATRDKFDNYFASLVIGRNKENILSDIYLNKCKEVYDSDFIMAAHWLISKECIIQTGGFSPVFYHYGEDNNFLHRLHFHGYKSGICPSLRVTHDREYRKRKPSELFYLKYTSAFLVELNNINNSLIKCIVKAYSTLIKDEIIYCIKYKSLQPLIYLWKCLFIINKSLYNRKVTKKGGLCFLKTND